eukprot:gene2978-3719_t
MKEKGTISVHSENIFPIIKKFLYSDHDVFLRELVANAVDATQKLKQLTSLGAYEGNVEKLGITVEVNEKLKTLTISDQGLGMTAEEVKQYINQVAFSGATAFVEKYKDQGQQQQLIGFFGLGFYSAFMVADRVDIITKSYQKDSEAVLWTCDGSTSFELSKAVKKEVGTDIVLHLNADSEEFLQAYKIKEVLQRYCKFLPVEITFGGEVINNTHPLWVKTPSELKDEDYLSFYKELYPFSPDPLFWIHLNVDYPFNLTGVLYFPKLTQRLEQNPNKIQLYARQVFITDEVKDIVPPFLMLLHGIIDSPDIPLNVSRSYLQADSNVKKINAYISKKVADKLEELFKKDQKTYEEKWPSMDLFVKYGMLTEDKFYERAKDFVLLKTVAGKYVTLPAYKETIKEKQTDGDQLVVLYAHNPAKQDWQVQACTQRGYDVLLLDGQLDGHFIETLESKLEKVRFKSVDSAPIDQLIGSKEVQSELTEKEQQVLQDLYKQAIPDASVTWSIASLGEEELPVVVTVPEFSKRLHAMAQMQPYMGTAPLLPLQAAINTNHPLVSRLLSMEDKGEQHRLALQAYQLGLLSQNMLEGAALSEFMKHAAASMAGKGLIGSALVDAVRLQLNVEVVGWGFSAHRHINRCAVFTLPPVLFTFYKHYLCYLTENAVRPDKRRYVVEGEDGKHYIDLDYYGEALLGKIPISWQQAIEQYPKATLLAHGTVPWHIAHMKNALTDAFRRQDVEQVLKLSADMGHYIADANVPLHTTQNYNGQLTGQEGIHSLWETRLPELFQTEYNCFVGQATYVSDPQRRAWEAVVQAHRLVVPLLKLEKELSQGCKELSKFSYEKRGEALQRVYTVSYAKAYHDALEGQVEHQLGAAIKMVGDFWLTCWMDAGCPNLCDLPQLPMAAEDEPITKDQHLCGSVRECGG